MNETGEETREFRVWGGLWRQPWWRCSQEESTSGRISSRDLVIYGPWRFGGVQLSSASREASRNADLEKATSDEWGRRTEGFHWSEQVGRSPVFLPGLTPLDEVTRRFCEQWRRGRWPDGVNHGEAGKHAGAPCWRGGGGGRVWPALAAALPQSLTGLAESSCVRTSEWTDSHRSQSSIVQEAPAEPCQPDGNAAFQKSSF